MMVSHHCRSVPQSTQPGPCWRTPGFSSPSSATYEQCWDDCYAKSLQSCPTLCDPMDSSPPGSPVPGILQARILEWVAISFSNAWKWKVKVKSLSRVWLLVTPWTAAYQAPPSMGFSRQEYWSGVPLPPPAEMTMRLQMSSHIWGSMQLYPLFHPGKIHNLFRQLTIENHLGDFQFFVTNSSVMNIFV